MSIKTCKQHAKDPVFIYAECAGCEIQRYRDKEKELKSENDSLRKDLDSHKRMLLSAAVGLGSIGEALGAEMDDDPREIEGLASELRKDAERLDFIESVVRSSYSGVSFVKDGKRGPIEMMSFHKRNGFQPTLRQAIDAAISSPENHS